MNSSPIIAVHRRQAWTLKWATFMREFLTQLVGVTLPWKLFGDTRSKEKIKVAATDVQEQAQALRCLAQSMYEWTRLTHAPWKTREEGKRFCAADSPALLLNGWNANVWILKKPKRLRQSKLRFEKAVQDLWITAREWLAADDAWRHSDSFKQGGGLMDGFSEIPTVEEIAKKVAAEEYAKAYDKFLIDYNEMRHCVNLLLQKKLQSMERSADIRTFPDA